MIQSIVIVKSPSELIRGKQLNAYLWLSPGTCDAGHSRVLAGVGAAWLVRAADCEIDPLYRVVPIPKPGRLTIEAT
jgi:hypothetical protein